jgi:hypothetical protein
MCNSPVVLPPVTRNQWRSGSLRLWAVIALISLQFWALEASLAQAGAIEHSYPLGLLGALA